MEDGACPPTPEPPMLRYVCPNCSQLLQAHELRAGKKSVCNVCLTSHIIPPDRAKWLTEAGEPLFPPQERAESVAEPHPMAIFEPIAVSRASSSTPTPVVEAPASAMTVEREPEPQPPAETPPPRLPEPRGSPATATPAPVRTAVRLSKVRTTDEASGMVVLDVPEPISARTQADIAGALTEALTQRMKPQRRPRRDLRPSTAAWLFLTGLGIAFLLVSLFTAADYCLLAAVLGVLQIAIGYSWIVSLTSQRDPQRGLACALPPVTLYYLGQWKYAKYRPLRFVVTGAAVAAFALLAPQLTPLTRAWAGSVPPPAPPLQRNIADLSKVEQLRVYRERKAYDKLNAVLGLLTKTDTLLSEDAKDRTALATEIKNLCSHNDTAVKVAAMVAYARWGGDDARDVCLAALGAGRTEDEKREALNLLPQWKHTDAAPLMAQAAAALVGRPGPGSVTTAATTAIEEIGGTAAENAVLGLLFGSDDQTVRLVALNLLDRIGGDETIAALPGYANTIIDQAIKAKALKTVEVIRARPKKKS